MYFSVPQYSCESPKFHIKIIFRYILIDFLENASTYTIVNYCLLKTQPSQAKIMPRTQRMENEFL